MKTVCLVLAKFDGPWSMRTALTEDKVVCLREPEIGCGISCLHLGDYNSF